MTGSNTLEKDRLYSIRLTDGRWVPGRFLYEKAARVTFTNYRQNRHFIFENVATGRTIEIKSMQRVRERAPGLPIKVSAGVRRDDYLTPVENQYQSTVDTAAEQQ